MKILFKLAIVALIFFVNLVIVPPSLADAPKVTKNPEYIELKQSLNRLLAKQEAQGGNSELQQKIDELQIQKTAMESGITWGQCRNETDKTIAVYGPSSEESESALGSELYFLASGESTPEKWDCNGLYLPSGIQVAGVDVSQPLVYRVLNGTQLVANTDQDGGLSLNAPPTQVLKAGDANWTIPNLSQAFIESRIPSTLTAGEIDD